MFNITRDEYNSIRFYVKFRRIEKLLEDERLLMGAYFIYNGDLNGPILTFDEGIQGFVFDETKYSSEDIQSQYTVAKFLCDIMDKWYLVEPITIGISSSEDCIKLIPNRVLTTRWGRYDMEWKRPDNFWITCTLKVEGDVYMLIGDIYEFVGELGFTHVEYDSVEGKELSDAISIDLDKEIPQIALLDTIPIEDGTMDPGFYASYQNETLTDFTFEVSNKIFNVYKLVLYVRGGDYFKTLYNGKFNSAASNMKIDFADDTIMSDYIDYIYL